LLVVDSVEGREKYLAQPFAPQLVASFIIVLVQNFADCLRNSTLVIDGDRTIVLLLSIGCGSGSDIFSVLILVIIIRRFVSCTLPGFDGFGEADGER